MAQVPALPVVRQIKDDIVNSLVNTNKQVGTEYHFATDAVVQAPGISLKWFSDPSWEHLYWVVIPEETSKPGMSKHWRSTLEVFIVGAKVGLWSLDPMWKDIQKPTREDVQYEIAADIKRAMFVDFRRSGLALNTDLTSTKYSFTYWAKFAIVVTRWEVEFDWEIKRP